MASKAPPPGAIEMNGQSRGDLDALEEQRPFLSSSSTTNGNNGANGNNGSTKPNANGGNRPPVLRSVTKATNAQQPQQQQQQRGVFGTLLALLCGIFLVALALILTAAKNSEDEGQCPGNLVIQECPCFQRCDSFTESEGLDVEKATKACSTEDCQMGCGCPSDKPFLTDSNTCSEVCDAVPAGEVQKKETERKVDKQVYAIDPTDCPIRQKYPKVPFAESELYQQKDTEVFHLRISPTYSCDTEEKNQLDVLLHFTLLVKGVNCDKNPAMQHFVNYYSSKEKSFMAAPAEILGCLNMNTNEYDVSIRGAWFFYVSRLTRVTPDSKIRYYIGARQKHNMAMMNSKKAPLRTFDSPLLPGQVNPDKPILVLGDTATTGAQVVAPSAAKKAGEAGYSLAIHVGDASYATNKGDCYEDKGQDRFNRCGYECTGVNCHGADKVQSEEMLTLYKWAKVLDENLGGKLPWVSTMGNHDNDLPWFLTYRPPVAAAIPGVVHNKPFPKLPWGFNEYTDRFRNPGKSNAQKQADAMTFMKWPHFFSFDHGLMHIIELGTEDNPINAYETWDGLPLSQERKERWEQHYGKNSPQYTWLEQDLKRASANREKVPWIIIYTHRPMYHTAEHHAWCSKGGDWYACLFVETYEPLLKKYGVNIFLTGHSHHYQRTLPMHKEAIVEKGTIHLIVGVGGYEVVGERWVRSPEWMASRQGTDLGYARFWVKNATSIYWEHVLAENGTTMDSVWFKNAFLDGSTDGGSSE